MKSGRRSICRWFMSGFLCVSLILQTDVIPAVSAEELPPEEQAVTEMEQETTVSSAGLQEDTVEIPMTQETAEEADESPYPLDAQEMDAEHSEKSVSSDEQSSSAVEAQPEPIGGAETDFQEAEISSPDEEMAVLSEDASGFSDTKGHWAEKIICFWQARKVVSGYPDGSFHPDESISRSEAASLIAKVRKLTGETHPFFSDVPKDHWAFDRIQACYTFEVMNGKGNSNFAPGDRITRQEAMTMLYRASDLTPSADEEAYLQQIADRRKVASWASEAIATLFQEGIISVYEDGKLYPTDLITRCDFLNILYQLEIKDAWDPTIYRTFALKDLKVNVRTENGLERENRTFSVTRCSTGEPTIVLPKFTDLHRISLEYQLSDADQVTVMISGNQRTALENPFDLTAISSPDEDGAYPLTLSLSDGEYQKDYHYRVYYETSLDSMFVISREDSGGRPHVDRHKGNSAKGFLQMVTENGDILYDGGLKEVKSRGNSTFGYPKKPYQIKLEEKADLLNNGEKGKTWVLLSNYADATMMNDKLCKDLAAEFRLPGSPECKWVDLYFDGEYRGVYLLTEKVQISSAGLNITDLEGMYEDVNSNYGDDTVTATSRNRYGFWLQYVRNIVDPADISNGYLLEINNQEVDENSGFSTRRGWGVNIKSPENLSRQAVKYISEYYQQFEDAVYAVNRRGYYTGINPSTGRSFTQYCDLESLARMYLLYQFSFNADAYIQSTYFYMENGILHQGPVWDSDQSFGITWTQVYSPNSRLRFNYLCEALEKLPVFRKEVKRIYDSEFRSLEEKYTRQMTADYRNLLSGSERMNHMIWPEYYVVSGLAEAWPQDTSYDTIIGNMQNWMSASTQYLDRKFRNW